jgi:hypothetical protein
MLKELYLVPFGREPGGYLDVLGLPPNAPVAAVSEQAKKYRQKLRTELRTQVKDLIARQESNEITKEELESRKADLEVEANKREADLNKLKETYDQQRSQQRGLKRSGQQEEAAGWVPLLRGLDGDADTLRQLLARKRPLPRVSQEFVDRVRQKLLDSASAGSRASDLPSNAARKPADLKALFELMTERDLIGLLWADGLWSRLEGTNRDYWQRQVAAWLDEIREIGPHLRRRAENGSGPLRHDYPHLSEPRKLLVAHLPEGAVEDEEPAPVRRADTTMDLQRFLEVAGDLGIDPEHLRDLLARSGDEGTDSDQPLGPRGSAFREPDHGPG